MTPGVVALGVGVVLLGGAVTVVVWGGSDRWGKLFGRASLVAILGGAAVGMLTVGVYTVMHGG